MMFRMIVASMALASAGQQFNLRVEEAYLPAVCGPAVTVKVDGEGQGKIMSDKCVDVGKNSAKAVVFCGPGTLSISHMKCNQKRPVYKFVHDKTKYTTQCETIDLAKTIASGHLGCFSLSC